MADEAGMPPYAIFSDKTLIEMAAYYPQSHESLLNIPGVGQVKLKQYGETFLDILKAYCEKHAIRSHHFDKLSATPQPFSQRGKGAESPPPRGRGAGGGGSELSPRTHIIAEAFNDGATMQRLMERHQLTLGTILEHLMKYLLAGNKLRSDNDLQSLTSATPEQQQDAFAAFEELNPTYLKPVFDKLNGTLSYDDLKFLRLMYLIEKQA